MEKPTYAELENRLTKAITINPNSITHAVWDGYLTALLEWQLIEISDFDKLMELIPKSQELTRSHLGVCLGEENAIECMANNEKYI